MAELADALDIGSSGRPCRFKSCYPHFLQEYVEQDLNLVQCPVIRILFFRKLYHEHAPACRIIPDGDLSVMDVYDLIGDGET